MITELSQVAIKLPVPFFGLKIRRTINFKFGTLAFSMMCQSAGIDFHQIDELMKNNSDSAMIKLIVGGAESYSWEQRRKGKKQQLLVTENMVIDWFINLRAKEKEDFLAKVNMAISNASVVGKTVSKLIETKQKKK